MGSWIRNVALLMTITAAVLSTPLLNQEQSDQKWPQTIRKVRDEQSNNTIFEHSVDEREDKLGHSMDWKQYHRLKDIHSYLDYLSKTYPEIVSVTSIGKSYERRDLNLLRVSNGNPTNKAVFIDGGIHAREWISPPTVTYFINQFAEKYNAENNNVKILIDTNGEAKALQTTIVVKFTEVLLRFRSLNQEQFGYGQYILYPWGYDNEQPSDRADLDAVGKKIAKAIRSTGNDTYWVGSTCTLLDPGAGGSDDWARSIGIKYSFTIELNDQGEHGFKLPPEYIEPVTKENLAGLRVFAVTI